MRLTFLMPSDYSKKKARLMFLTVLASFCVSVHAQQQKVALSGSNLTLKTAFRQIEQQTNLFIDYDSNELDDSQILKSIPKGGTIDVVLTRLLPKSFTVSYQNNHVVIAKGNSVTKSVQLTGKVTDMNGEPIIGANVMEKGTTNGTITDVEGRFSLNIASADAILREVFP